MPQVSGRTQNVPLEKVVDDIAVMGFSRADVSAATWLGSWQQRSRAAASMRAWCV